MELRIKRIKKTEKVTIGTLSINGAYVCDTLEDKDRGLKSTDSLADIKKVKVWGETAIPTGRYKITLKVKSPKFSMKKYYADFCGGYMPRILDIPGYSGVLIHRGINETHTEGCILVGKSSGNILTASKECFEKVYTILKGASDKGEAITLTIE